MSPGVYRVWLQCIAYVWNPRNSHYRHDCIMKIDCQHWAENGNHGTCALGKYGGRPSLGVCRLICLGVRSSDIHTADTPLPPIPSWLTLRATIAARWPDWLPEFDAARTGMAGCTNCQDHARRARWQERIASAAALEPST